MTTAAQAYGGLNNLVNNTSDVFAPLGKGVLGSGLDKLLIITVLTSASASTQTTILPTARTTLSMARAKAIPKQFGNVHPRFLYPGLLDDLDGHRLDDRVRAAVGHEHAI